VKSIIRLAMALVPTAVLGACSDTTFETGGPVSIELTADRTTARTGEDVRFTFEAEGSALSGVIIDYGDGVADTMSTHGAREARGQFVHAYVVVGTFTAVGTAIDAREGPAADGVVIQVTGS